MFLALDFSGSFRRGHMSLLWALGRSHDFFLRLAEELGMQIMAAFLRRFVFFHWNAVRVGVGILPDTGYLPRDFDSGLVRPDDEAVVVNLLSHNGLREFA